MLRTLTRYRAAMVFATCVAFTPTIGGADDNEDIAAKYTGLAEAERPALRSAECGELRANLKGLPDDLDCRVDLWVTGRLSAIQTDGALWYVSLCLAPDIKVLCVTYESNDLKIGDRIFARGAYMRPDDHHIMLDPCLASASETEGEIPSSQK